MPTSAEGRKRRKRIVSGIFFVLCASMRAWSKAILARPPRMPVSMTLNAGASDVMLDILSLGQPPTQLAPHPADVVAIELERVGGDVARRRIPVRPIAGGDIGCLLAGAAEVRKATPASITASI